MALPRASPLASSPLIQTNLHFKRLTPLEALACLVGTNVGAAVLALPFAARHAGRARAAINTPTWLGWPVQAAFSISGSQAARRRDEGEKLLLEA